MENFNKIIGAVAGAVAVGAVAYGAYRVKKQIYQKREFNKAKVDVLNASLGTGRFEVSKFSTDNKGSVTVTLVEKEVEATPDEVTAARRKKQAETTAANMKQRIVKNVRARKAA